MKVLFLYNDRDHAWPALQAVAPLANHGVELCGEYEQSAQGCLKYLSRSFEVLMIHQELVTDDIVACGRPVIILERIDGAQLGAARRWLADVAAVFKGYSYRDPQDHNRYRGRAFVHRLAAAGLVASNSGVIDGQPPQLAERDLAKIRTWYGFGAYQKQQHLVARPIDLRSPRPISVHFAGTVTYNGTEIETHRKLAAKIAASIAGGLGEAGRPLRKGMYSRTMEQSKSVLCPFGWGESAHRDYEAMLLGCVMIKPDCSSVDCWPQIYLPGVTYLPCRMDFADIPALVDQVASNWQSYRKWRERCCRLAREAAVPDKIALRFKELLEQVL